MCNGRDDDCDLEIDEEGCACDRVTNGASVYLLCTTGATHADASADCVAAGYHLVYVADAGEQDFVWGQARARIVNDWWIGMTDSATEGRYLWLDGTVVWEAGSAAGYAHFRDGDPGANDGEDCIEMDGPSDGMWADGTCDQIQPYICEL